MNTGSFPFGIRVCSVWSGSALSTYAFIYSHALNFYLIINKQLQISGRPFKTFLCVPIEWQKNQATAWVLLALNGVGWHWGVAGSTHPKTGEAVLDPCAEPSLPQRGWEVTGALGKREGMRIHTSQWEGTLSSGVEEAVGKGVGTAHFRWCQQMYLYIFVNMFYGKFSKKQLLNFRKNCRKITCYSNLPC